MTVTKHDYRVLPGHRESVAGIQVVTGQILSLTDSEALYERDLGYIEPVEVPTAPILDPLRAGDIVILQRGGNRQIVPAGALAAFFAPLLGGSGTTPPAYDNTLALMLDLGSSLAVF